jgi:hypothetical protein
LKGFPGNLLDALRDSPSVLGFERNGFENQQVEGSLDQIGGFHMPSPSTIEDDHRVVLLGFFLQDGRFQQSAPPSTSHRDTGPLGRNESCEDRSNVPLRLIEHAKERATRPVSIPIPVADVERATRIADRTRWATRSML